MCADWRSIPSAIPREGREKGSAGLTQAADDDVRLRPSRALRAANEANRLAFQRGEAGYPPRHPFNDRQGANESWRTTSSSWGRLRIAAGLEDAVRRTQDPSRLPARRGRPDQREGFRVRLPVKGRKDRSSLIPPSCPASEASGAAGVNPKDYDLILPRHAGAAVPLAWRSRTARRGAKSKVPCMSIMNMPPLPYVKRIPASTTRVEPAYTDARSDSFDPNIPDAVQPGPQAIRRRTRRSTC